MNKRWHLVPQPMKYTPCNKVTLFPQRNLCISRQRDKQMMCIILYIHCKQPTFHPHFLSFQQHNSRIFTLTTLWTTFRPQQNSNLLILPPSHYFQVIFSLFIQVKFHDHITLLICALNSFAHLWLLICVTKS